MNFSIKFRECLWYLGKQQKSFIQDNLNNKMCEEEKESYCNIYPCRSCTAINNSPPPTIHDPSNDAFHLVEVNKFHRSKVFIIFNSICGGVNYSWLTKVTGHHVIFSITPFFLLTKDTNSMQTTP